MTGETCEHPSCHAPATDERRGWVWCRAHLFWALQAEQEPARELEEQS